jgi:hypothetical protein
VAVRVALGEAAVIQQTKTSLAEQGATSSTCIAMPRSLQHITFVKLRVSQYLLRRYIYSAGCSYPTNQVTG